VNYEIRIACFIAVKMLVGNQTSVWEGTHPGIPSGHVKLRHVPGSDNFRASADAMPS
jgi:hypothetical protein